MVGSFFSESMGEAFGGAALGSVVDVDRPVFHHFWVHFDYCSLFLLVFLFAFLKVSGSFLLFEVVVAGLGGIDVEGD